MIRRIFCLFALTALISPAVIQYSGAIPTVATGTPATQTALADLIKDTVTTAGWSCAGASGDWKCTTAADASATGQIKLRMWDPSTGVSTRLAILNTSESIDLSAAPTYILPDGSTWTIIANKFHVYGYSNGAFTERHAFHSGTLYKPDFLTGLTTFGYQVCSGNSDTGSGNRPTFRQEIFAGNSKQQVIVNAASFTAVPSTGLSGNVCLTIQQSSGSANQGRQWWDDSYMILDPMIKSDDVSNGGVGQGKWMGQLWDCLVVGWKSFNEGDEITYDSKTWRAITDGGANGTLFHYVPTP